MALKTYRDLEVWQRSMDLVEATYHMARRFPRAEQFGLTSQLQRAAVSVPANIAEGYARTHRGDYVHHLSISRGSLAELETHVALAVRLKFVAREDALEVWGVTQEVGRLLNRLIASLQGRSRSNPEPRTPNPKRTRRN